MMLIMARNGFKETMQITTAKDTVWFIGLNFIYLVISMTVFLTGIKGCVLAFNVLCLTHILIFKIFFDSSGERRKWHLH